MEAASDDHHAPSAQNASTQNASTQNASTYLQAIAYARSRPLKNWRLLRDSLPTLKSHVTDGVQSGGQTLMHMTGDNENENLESHETLPVCDTQVPWLACEDYNAVYGLLKAAHGEAARRDYYDVLPEKLVPLASAPASSQFASGASRACAPSAPPEESGALPHGLIFPSQDLLQDLQCSHSRQGFLDRITLADVAWAVRQCIVHTSFHASAFRDHS
jgi:hypothetical protein